MEQPPNATTFCWSPYVDALSTLCRMCGVIADVKDLVMPDDDREASVIAVMQALLVWQPGFALPNRSGVPPTLGSGIPSSTGGIPLNTAQIQKFKTRRLYNRFGVVYRSVQAVYRSVRAVYR
jgi:hypothetical protein